MARSKAYLFDPKDQLTSTFARALAHPARLNILRHLVHSESCTVETLHSFCPISQPALSQHLKLLREVQLVSYVEKFPYTYYKLNGKNFEIARTNLTGFFKLEKQVSGIRLLKKR